MKITLLLISLALTGCAFVKGTRNSDGSLTVDTRRFFWASEGIDFKIGDTNGFYTSLKVQKSSADSQALGAVAEGAARGAASVVK